MSAPHDQHFLIDKKAIKKIVGTLEIENRRILEIGPGEGALTEELLRGGAHVIAIELDSRLIDDLASRFCEEISAGKLDLILGNAVKCDIPQFDIVISNLPYSASSRIIFRLLDIGFEAAVLMFQKEFAQRMVAPPGTPAFGRLSVMVQTYATAQPILELSPNAFRPKPQVSSWVMKIVPHPPPYPISDKIFYADVVRSLFSHRRKTVRKALKISTKQLGEKKVFAILSTLDESILGLRPEVLSLQQFAEIANRGSTI